MSCNILFAAYLIRWPKILCIIITVPNSANLLAITTTTINIIFMLWYILRWSKRHGFKYEDIYFWLTFHASGNTIKLIKRWCSNFYEPYPIAYRAVWCIIREFKIEVEHLYKALGSQNYTRRLWTQLEDFRNIYQRAK